MEQSSTTPRRGNLFVTEVDTEWLTAGDINTVAEKVVI
jgi:hypothetical protein